MVDGNLKALIIEGNPTHEAIAEAWQGIEQEYVDTIGKGESRVEMALYAEIDCLTATHDCVLLLIARMQESYHPEFAKRLNALLKINFVFDPADPEKYYALLKNCYNRSKGIKLDLDLKKIQYEAIEAKIKAEMVKTPYSHEYFQTILINLSDFAQYQIQDNISVFEYCTRIKLLNKYNEEMEKRNKAQTSKKR